MTLSKKDSMGKISEDGGRRHFRFLPQETLRNLSGISTKNINAKLIEAEANTRIVETRILYKAIDSIGANA
jgi:hypothetical protein